MFVSFVFPHLGRKKGDLIQFLLQYVMVIWSQNFESGNFVYNIIGDELLLNFGAKFQREMRKFCNLIGLEKWYSCLI